MLMSDKVSLFELTQAMEPTWEISGLICEDLISWVHLWKGNILKSYFISGDIYESAV